MKKVVINRCFGGFGLSPRAIEKYARLKGKPCYFFRNVLAKPDRCTLEEAEKENSLSVSAFSKDEPNYEHVWSEGRISREDPDLVRVVEELGNEASGRFADLKVVEIPDDVEYFIDEYDGLESIHEQHRIWT